MPLANTMIAAAAIATKASISIAHFIFIQSLLLSTTDTVLTDIVKLIFQLLAPLCPGSRPILARVKPPHGTRHHIVRVDLLR